MKKIKLSTVSKLLGQFTLRIISSIFIQSSWFFFFRQWASLLNWVSDKCFVFKCRKVDYFILSMSNWIRNQQERLYQTYTQKIFSFVKVGGGSFFLVGQDRMVGFNLKWWMGFCQAPWISLHCSLSGCKPGTPLCRPQPLSRNEINWRN